MALFHRVYRVLCKQHQVWHEWTSINPFAKEVAESHPSDYSEELGDHHSNVFQSMIAGGWHTFGNEHTEYTIRLVKSTEDVKW